MACGLAWGPSIGALSFIYIHSGYTIKLCHIDFSRMKLKEDEPIDGTPVPFTHVFGDWWPAYFFPLEPYFSDEEAVYHYRIGETDYCQKGL